MTTADFADSTAALLRRHSLDGDPAHLDQAIALARTSPADRRGQPAVDLAQAHLERYRCYGDQDDLDTAVAVLDDVLRAPLEPEVRAAGLRHCAACEQERYLAGAGRGALNRAIAGFERAVATLPVSSAQRPILLTEFGTVLQDRFAEDGDLRDIDRAVALAEEAAAADPDGDDAPAHLVNLGTARYIRYESTTDPADLDAALRSWTSALGLLPPGSPYRAAFHDRLTVGHSTRWEHGSGTPADLDAAVEHGRAAGRLGASAPDRAVYVGHLADALRQRWDLSGDPADLDAAVEDYAAVTAGLDAAGVRATELLANLAHLHLARYQEFGDHADVDAALNALAGIGPVAGRGRRTAVASATARALAMRYQSGGDPADLTAAIAAARRALVGVDPVDVVHDSRTARLSMLLVLRYHRLGRRRDLDTAIAALREAQVTSANQLGQLSAYLGERHDRDGDPADRLACLAYAEQARAADRSGFSPTIAAGLATALQDRFAAEGRHDDLDAAIGQHRAAVARTRATAPAYPTLLHNLGLALQHVAAYRDDETAADEAIEIHERAVAAAGDAPGRAGLLHALAGAVLLRYERDSQPTDLERVATLEAAALAGLGARSPDRAGVLAGLATARHLLARAAGDRDSLTFAIATYRAALRALGRNGAVRAHVLRGCAEAWAEGGDTAAAQRAFRAAATAAADSPVALLDTSTAWGDWALRTRRWPQAAAALAMAADARRALFAVQRHRTYRDAWLTRAGTIAAGEAYARLRIGDRVRAVTALDAGRALALSEQLDARTIVDRLRATGHSALAGRLELATRRFALLTAAPVAPPGAYSSFHGQDTVAGP